MQKKTMRKLIGVPLAGLFVSGLAFGQALAQDTLRWGVSAVLAGGHMLPPMLELDKDVQAKHNLDIKVTNFNGNNPACIAALLSDAVDICQVGASAGMAAIAEGADLKGFMQQAGQTVEFTLAKPVFDKLGVPVTAPVADRIKALKGLTIASPGPGTTNYYIIQDILAVGGLTLSDIRLQPLVDITAMNASLQNGRIDAGFWSVGGMTPSQSSGAGVRFVALAYGDLPELKEPTNIAVYGKTAWVEKNKELLRRAQLGLSDVLKKLKADPIAYAKAYKDKYLPAVDEKAWETDLPAIVGAFYDDIEGTKSGWDFWIARFGKDAQGDYSKASYDNAYVKLAP